MAYREFAYAYDRLMEDMPYAEWLSFAEECWAMFGRPRTIVDLGCGTGNLALPLAEAGYHVFGIDFSEDMLAVARSKADDRLYAARGPGSAHATGESTGGSVTWLQQDMREWELPSPVDCVLSFCDCMNYLLEEEDIVRTIHRVYAGLQPGGLFLFDVHTQAQLQAYAAEQPFILDEEDVAYLWTCDLDEERCEIEHQLTIFVAAEEGGTFGQEAGSNRRHLRSAPVASSGLFRRVEEIHVQRAYDLDWLTLELQRAGFTDVKRYADFSLLPPAEDTMRAFFVARK